MKSKSAASPNKGSFLLELLGVFLIAFLFLLFLHFQSENLLGLDGYYHIQYAKLLWANGLSVLSSFPWTQYSILTQYPTDMSLGYHMFVSPFIQYFGDITGMKIATAALGAGVVSSFWYVLKVLGVRASWVWSILLLVVSVGFLHRLMMPRDYVVGIISILLSVGFVVQRKYLYLFLTTVVGAYSYVGFPLILVVVILWSLVNLATKGSPDMKALGVTFFGLGIAIVGRPDFPNNIIMTYYQDFIVLLRRAEGTNLNFGAELGALDLSSAFTWLVFAMFGVAMAIFVAKAYGAKKAWGMIILFSYTLSLALFSILFHVRVLSGAELLLLFIFLVFVPIVGAAYSFPFKNFSSPKQITQIYLVVLGNALLLMALASARFIEYFIPIALVVIAIYYSNITRQILGFLNPALWLRSLGMIFGSLLVSGFGVVGVLAVDDTQNDSREIAPYIEAGSWMKENIPASEIIFHPSWDDFAPLFYGSSDHYYISGMDPVFAYEFDKSLYWGRRHLTEGAIDCSEEECVHEYMSTIGFDTVAHEKVSKNFHAKYVVVPRLNIKSPSAAFENLIDQSDLFKNVFTSVKEDIKIYKLN